MLPVTGGVTKIDSPEGVIQHVYNPATGRLIETFTANNDTTYSYDSQGRLWQVKVNKLNGVSYTPARITTYQCDKVGNLLSEQNDEGTPSNFSDDVDEAYTYTPLNRLDTLTAKVGSHTLFAQGSFTYTGDGQKTGLVEHRYDGQTGAVTATTRMTWGYDEDGRLTSETRDEGNDGVQNGGDCRRAAGLAPL